MIAYLDNSATTQPSEAVIEAMTECMREGFYNPSSLYAPAMRAEKQLDKCRSAVMKSIHVKDGHVIFTSGGTEANNLALMGAVKAMHGKRHILVSDVEHPSVLAAAEALEEMGHKVSRLPVDREGKADLERLENILKNDAPDLISIMQVNNETGSINPIAEISRLTRSLAPDALLHVDGVQGFLRVDFDARLADMYTLSGHKIRGPKGIGALWIRKGVRVLPRQIGGGQEWQYRSGTQNTPGIAGLLCAVQSMPSDAPEIMMKLKLRLAEGLKDRVEGLIVNGPAPQDGAPHILNVSFPGVRGEVMLHALEGENVYVSTGSACSSKKRKLSPVLLSMGIPADIAECAIRLSLSANTTEEEIDYACAKADTLYEALRRFRRK